MEHFLLYAFTLSLVSFLGIILSKQEAVTLAHQESDQDTGMAYANRISSITQPQRSNLDQQSKAIDFSSSHSSAETEEYQKVAAQAHAVSDYQFS